MTSLNGSTSRYGIYFSPRPGALLHALGSQWLGRDAETGDALDPDLPESLTHDEWLRATKSPRRYGFHATLKPPFRLAEGTAFADLQSALREFAAGHKSFEVPSVSISPLGRFLALILTEPSDAFSALAADCVSDFEISALLPPRMNLHSACAIHFRRASANMFYGGDIRMSSTPGSFICRSPDRYRRSRYRRLHCAFVSDSLRYPSNRMLVDSVCIFHEPVSRRSISTCGSRGPGAIMTLTSFAAESAWKPCDLRGVYPDVVSSDLFRSIGGAIGTMLSPSARVVVAGDFRLSTPELKYALTDGLLHAGVRVLDAGQGPTPLAYFAAHRLESDAVLIVTASHNPPAHNGLKLMLGSEPTTPQQLLEIRRHAELHEFRLRRGSMKSVNPRPLYTRTMLERWECLRRGKPARVVLDAGNGAWSELAPEIFQRLGFEVACISCVIRREFS